MDNFDELIDSIFSIESRDDLNSFFLEIFTEKERRDMSLRWKLMKMLKEGYTQRKIASMLKISLCKITRGSKIIKDENSICNKFLWNEKKLNKK